MIKKIVLLLALAAALTLVFAACGDDDWDSTPVTTDDGGSAVPPGGGRGGAVGGDGEPLDIPEGAMLPEVDLGTWEFLRFPAGHIVHDPIVYAVEVNQSLSWGVDTYTGEWFLMDHFAAGKETAIFINFTEPAANLTEGGNLIFVSVYHNGSFVAQIDWIDIDPFDPYTLWFQPRAMSDVGHWAAGEYTFVVLINGQEVAERTTTFYPSRAMRVLTVPIIANYGGHVLYPTGEWQHAGGMIHGTFPVARADVEIVFAPELDLSDSRYDVTTPEGQFNVWQALVNMQTRCGRYNAIKGYLPEMIPVEGGVLQGFTWGAPAAISTENDPQLLSTVIHEIAHFYLIGDEYPDGTGNFRVNVPPYGQPVRDWFNRDVTVQGYRQPVWSAHSEDPAQFGTGSIIHAAQRPFYVEGGRFMGNVSSYMGIGGARDPWATWVTSDIWIHLFRTFTGALGGTSPTPQALASGTPEVAMVADAPAVGPRCTECSNIVGEMQLFFRCEGSGTWLHMPPGADEGDISHCPDCYHPNTLSLDTSFVGCGTCDALMWFHAFIEHNTPAQRMLGRTVEPPEVMAVEVRGTMNIDGTFEPLPWFTFEAELTDLDTQREGEFTMYFWCAADNVLSTAGFDLDFFSSVRTEEGNRDIERDSVPVDFLFEFPTETNRITINRGDAEIYSVTLSSTAPEVALIGLSENQNLGDSFTLEWEASGERDLFFEIWYSPIEDVWYSIATDVTGNSFTVDLTGLPGTSEGFFYVYVSDGVRTGSAYSPWIVVPYKAPTIITDLSEIPRFPVTDEFILDVDISDLQDISLWCVDEVTWTLDGRHFIGGSGLWIWPFELNPGYHTFHLEAVNSAGLSVEGEFTVYVIDDDSALPDDWSRGDIVTGLSQGFIVDLRRLDTPITRGRFATFMMNVYFDMLEDDFDYVDFPEYEEGVILDGGQDSYDFFMMTYLGMMDAPEGRFNPNGTVTEREAALIMYRTAALADPQWFWDDADDDQILNWLLEIGALENDGPNAFNESEPLTSRLAMVRLARFYAAVFAD